MVMVMVMVVVMVVVVVVVVVVHDIMRMVRYLFFTLYPFDYHNIFNSWLREHDEGTGDGCDYTGVHHCRCAMTCTMNV